MKQSKRVRYVVYIGLLILFAPKALLAESSLDFKEDNSYHVGFLQSNSRTIKEKFKKKHIGLELVLANASILNAESIFGHIMLRFIDEDTDPLNDTIINFYQSSNDDQKKLQQALRGASNLPHVGTFADNLIVYMKSDSRIFRRFIIPIDNLKMLKLKKIIYEISVDPKIIGDYSLLKNNCYTAVLKLLKAIGFPVISRGGIVDLPTNVERDLMLHGVLLHPELRNIRGAVDIIKDLERLPSKEEHSPKDIFENRIVRKKLNKMTHFNLHRLMYFFPFKWFQYEDLIHEKIQSSRVYVSLDTLLKNELPVVAKELYTLCDVSDEVCFKQKFQASKNLWNSERISKHAKKVFVALEVELNRYKEMPKHKVEAIESSKSVVAKNIEKMYELSSARRQ